MYTIKVKETKKKRKYLLRALRCSRNVTSEKKYDPCQCKFHSRHKNASTKSSYLIHVICDYI